MKDADGNLILSTEASKETTDDSITEKTKETDAEGTTTETVDMVKTDGTEDFSKSTVVTDKDGNTVSSSEQSKETASNGTVTEMSKVLHVGTTTEEKEVTALDKSGSYEKTVTEANGDVKGGSVTKAAGGEVSSFTNSSTIGGESSLQTYKSGDNGFVLEKSEGDKGDISVGGKVQDVSGDSHTITVIGDGAFAGNTDITSATIDGSVNRIGNDAFRGCERARSVRVKARLDYRPVRTNGKKKAYSITLGKNCLKGTSKKLVIEVPDKKTKKDIKKQLKKAGNPKAKVKIVK